MDGSVGARERPWVAVAVMSRDSRLEKRLIVGLVEEHRFLDDEWSYAYRLHG